MVSTVRINFKTSLSDLLLVLPVACFCACAVVALTHVEEDTRIIKLEKIGDGLRGR